MDLDTQSSASWTLLTLPIDDVRSIFEYLDYSELLSLYATLDRRMQKLIATPDIVYQLSCPSRHHLHHGRDRLFLQSIRNVKLLRFGDSRPSDSKLLPLLTTLNPRTLILQKPQPVPKLLPSLITLETSPKDEDALQATKFMTVNGFPDLALLTPRLETLICNRIDPYICNQHWDLYKQRKEREGTWYQLSLPPSLTSLEISDHLHTSLIRSLPSTLGSLKVGRQIDGTFAPVALLELFSRLKHLESLDISQCSYNAEDMTNLVFPRSLTTLKLNSSLFALPLLSRLKSSKIQHLKLCPDPDLHRFADGSADGLNLGACMPPSLISLDWSVDRDQSGGFGAYYPTLPSTITDLRLMLTGSFKNYLDCLKDLPSLTTLSILFSTRFTIAVVKADGSDEVVGIPQLKSSSSGSTTLRLNLLPHSILHLILIDGRSTMLSPLGVENLPPNLQCLSMSCFHLEQHEALIKRYPNCILRIIDPVALFNSTNGQWLRHKFAEETSNVWNWSRFSDSVIRHFAPHRISFALTPIISDSKTTMAKLPNIASFIQTPYRDPLNDSIRLSGALKLDSTLFTAMKGLTELKLDFPATIEDLASASKLTRLDLGSADPGPNLVFPKALTHLTATSTIDVPFRLGDTNVPKLNHLDAPNWSFSAGYLNGCITDLLETLKCTVKELPDYAVTQFLTITVHRRARFNAEISVLYWTTGFLVPEEGDNALKIVTRETLRQATDVVLKRELQLPMPAPEGLATDSDFDVPMDTVGRIVKSLKCHLEEERFVVSSIPHSATAVCMESSQPWKLSTCLLGRHFPQIAGSLPYRLEDAALLSAPLSTVRLQNRSGKMIPLDTLGSTLSFFTTSNHILTRMELMNVTGVENWWSKLPPSLRYLHIRTPDPISKVGAFIPPLIKTFILETGLMVQDKYQYFAIADLLPFSFLDLPASLEHLVILADSFCLSDLAVECKARVKLPRLKSVLLQHATDVTIDSLCSMLPLRQLERFEVANMVQTLGSGRAVPVALGTPEQLKRVAGGAYVEEKSKGKLKLLGSIDFSAIRAPPIDLIDAQVIEPSTASPSDANDASSLMDVQELDESPEVPRARKRAVRRPRK